MGLLTVREQGCETMTVVIPWFFAESRCLVELLSLARHKSWMRNARTRESLVYSFLLASLRRPAMSFLLTLVGARLKNTRHFAGSECRTRCSQKKRGCGTDGKESGRTFTSIAQDPRQRLTSSCAPSSTPQPIRWVGQFPDPKVSKSRQCEFWCSARWRKK